MEKEKRKDTPLSPRQRYLPLVIMGVLLVFTIFPQINIVFIILNWLFEETKVRDLYWSQYVQIVGILTWILIVLIIPIGYIFHVYRKRHQYNWSWEIIVFLFIAAPTFLLNSCIFVLALAHSPQHIISMKYGNYRYYIQSDPQGLMDDNGADSEFILFRCNFYGASCEQQSIGYSYPSMDSGRAVRSIAFLTIDENIAICTINGRNEAFLAFIENDPVDNYLSYIRIWDHPVEDHPQCNAESFQ